VILRLIISEAGCLGANALKFRWRDASGTGSNLLTYDVGAGGMPY
jgi:hypothetical protein